MAQVQFGVRYWVYGEQVIDLPSFIDPSDEYEVINYIESVFEDLPLPQGSWIEGSDSIDYESIEVVE